MNMQSNYRRALSIPSPAYRRRIFLTIPASIAVAMIEALGFTLLYALLQGFTGDGDLTSGGTISTLYEWSGFDDESSFLWALSIAIVVLMLVKGISAVGLLWWQSEILSASEAETSNRLFRAYLRAPHSFHLKKNSAELIRNTQGSVTVVYQNVLLGMVTVSTELSIAAAVSIVLIVADPIIAMLALVMIALAAIGYAKGLSQFSRRAGARNQEFMSVVQQKLHEGLGGVKIFQVLNRQESVSDDYAETRTAWAATRRSIIFVNQLPRYYLEFVLLLGIAVIALGAGALRDGDQAVASVGLLLASALRLLPSLNKTLSALNRAQVGFIATAEVAEEMAKVEQLEAEAVAAQSSTPVTFTERITIHDLTFTYEGGEEPALDGLDLTIERGESVGIVGASGSGKTTLVDVLLGLLWPERGGIRVDDTELTPELLASWRSLVGYVAQDIFVADASLRKNVALGLKDDEIDDDLVMQALRQSNLEEFVAALPAGLDTRMGERGTRFSGGQRQRVGIARALYHQPEILLLDEATSALDGVTEAAVSSTIASLHGQVTMVTIAHRLSTVRDCDKLVLLDQGKILDVGDFDSLAETSAEFAEMVRTSTA